jgi:hypothetical protein
MKMTLIDRSNYFKGLLLLIRKDQKTTQSEIDLMKRIGKILGFEKTFCANAIDEILANPYIIDEPSCFSSKEIAVKFIKDGLSLAFVDNNFHTHEEQWLRSTAEKNGLGLDFFSQEMENARSRKGYLDRLEADDLTVVQ